MEFITLYWHHHLIIRRAYCRLVVYYKMPLPVSFFLSLSMGWSPSWSSCITVDVMASGGVNRYAPLIHWYRRDRSSSSHYSIMDSSFIPSIVRTRLQSHMILNHDDSVFISIYGWSWMMDSDRLGRDRWSVRWVGFIQRMSWSSISNWYERWWS